MKLPWKGGRIALIAAAGEGRSLYFILCCIATLGTMLFFFLNPQIIRITVDSIIGDMPLNAPAFVSNLVEAMGGLVFLRKNIWICAIVSLAAAVLSGLCNVLRRYTIIELGETMAWKLRNTLFGHIQKLPFKWHVS